MCINKGRYNEDGLRTKKTITDENDVVTVTEYTLRGKNIVHMKKGVHNLHFFYDGQGKPSIVAWNNGTTTNKYAYVYNLQGDVIALVNSAGTKVVNYTYDAWGKPITKTGSLAGTLGTLNPFRYRGYVYDDETGLYYLRSRYYNANRGRFINADIVFDGVNLFRYCHNDQINFFDKNGNEEEHFIYKGYDYTKWVEELSEDHKIFISTVCGEAIGESRESWISVAWVIVNRVGHREWRKYDNTTDIIKNTGFNGNKGPQYNKSMEYLNHRDGSNMLYEAVISSVMPVYYREIDDITSYSTMYYSPRPDKNPPGFANHPKTVEVIIDGVNRDKLRFYRYIEDTDPWRMNGKDWIRKCLS